MVGIQLVLMLCLIVLMLSLAAFVAGVVLVTRGMKATGYGLLATGIVVSIVIIAFGIWACAQQLKAYTMRKDYSPTKRFNEDFKKWITKK